MSYLLDFQDIKVLDDCKMVIFDLDDTLIFRYSDIFAVHAREILQFLRLKNIKMTVASLNVYADEILDRAGVIHYFDDIQQRIYRECGTKWGDYNKIPMFIKMNKKYGISYENMILFDDNSIHCSEAIMMNMKAVRLDNKMGITWKDFKSGMSRFSNRRNSC